MGKKATLTIDNGPTPGVTEHVLDILRKHNLTATFFVVGENVVRPGGRDLIARIHDEGHRLGNHTFTHSVLFGSAPDQAVVISEIERTQAALGPFGTERLFRPFAGVGNLDQSVMSRTALEYLSTQEYTMVLWNSIPGDWKDPQGWPDTAVRHIVENDWTVTVVHDLPTGAMDALERFILMARDNGAEFQTDFPDKLVPLVAGKKKFPMDQILSDL
jgi:peptidoglycan/xylan/chitin deacetylase (PgdA/CDA1 family)